jgi:hypothetical protein
VCLLELPRRLERTASQLGENDKLSCGQFEGAWHVQNLSCSLMTGALYRGSTGGRKMMSDAHTTVDCTLASPMRVLHHSTSTTSVTRHFVGSPSTLGHMDRFSLGFGLVHNPGPTNREPVYRSGLGQSPQVRSEPWFRTYQRITRPH